MKKDGRIKLDDWQVDVLHSIKLDLKMSDEQLALFCWLRWGVKMSRLGIRKRMLKTKILTEQNYILKAQELDFIFGEGYCYRRLGEQAKLF